MFLRYMLGAARQSIFVGGLGANGLLRGEVLGKGKRSCVTYRPTLVRHFFFEHVFRSVQYSDASSSIGDRPFSCDVCGKSFSEATTLAQVCGF
jgi:hypothetical protein